MDKTFGNVKKTYNLKSKNGITIVALITTIVVMLILTSITIGAINGNLLDYTGKGKIKTEITELNSSLMKKLLISDNKNISGKINDILNIESPYNDKLEIENGELVYISSKWTEDEIEMLKEMGIGMGLYDFYKQSTDIYYIAMPSTKTAKYGDLDNVGTLEDFRNLVNAGTFTYDEARLIEDIKLNEGKYTIANGEITFAEDAVQWTPIGTNSKYFSKIFDGQNHIISGIYINNENLSKAGLFSQTSGTIKNLGLENGKITAKNYVGGIVGSGKPGCTIINSFNGNSVRAKTGFVGGIAGNDGNSSILIEGCYNKGNISSDTYICGGIIANTNAGAIVKECYNLGKVHGTGASIGGIVGQGYVNIEKCYNNGNVIGANYVGGIIGSGSTLIKECYNSGVIEGTQYIGGIVGGSNGNEKVFNCYNVGTILHGGNRNNGGIIGLNYSKVINCYTIKEQIPGTKENSYYLVSTATSDTSAKTESFMKSQAFVTLLNTVTTTTTDEETGEETTTTATQDVWAIDTNNINEGYPILKWQK